MKILLLSQVYWPDTASTSQHLSDLAERLAAFNEVRVLTSRHNYENPNEKYQKREIRKGVRITRLNNTAFGKKHMLARLADFFSFNFLLFFRLIRISGKNTDLILGMTSPPLVSFFGVFFAKKKHIAFAYWTMDLQPELSISSGLIRRHSLAARLFQGMGNYIFKNADKVITLDKYMAAYVTKRGANSEKVFTTPVWPVMDRIYEGQRELNPFRIQHAFGQRLVVMYSGNHSYIHPLDTLLEAALLLKDDPRFVFVFIGGGVRVNDVRNFKERHHLESIVQLRYQPRDQIHFSLGSADLQVVILGENQVGFTHPNKIYGAMFLGKPVLYIGPSPSHVTDIISRDQGNIIVNHGDVQLLRNQLVKFAEDGIDKQETTGRLNRSIAFEKFHPEALQESMVRIITS